MDRLEEIRERCEAATLGPWGVHRYSVEDWNGNQICGDFVHEADKEFIARAREDIPFLLAMVETLQVGQKMMESDQHNAEMNLEHLTAEVERLAGERGAAVRRVEAVSVGPDDFLIVEERCIEKYSKRQFLPTPVPRTRKDAPQMKIEDAVCEVRRVLEDNKGRQFPFLTESEEFAIHALLEGFEALDRDLDRRCRTCAHKLTKRCPWPDGTYISCGEKKYIDACTGYQWRGVRKRRRGPCAENMEGESADED